jgi:hypothetical protein
MSTTDPQAIPALPAACAPQTRASDADRDATYAARTWHQLRQLTADLADTAGTTERRTAPGMAAEPDLCLLCLLCLLLIVCPPAGIAWWLLSRRRPGADPDGQLTAAAAQAGGGPRAEDR